MTQGVVIFAFNNEQIDYLAMAAWSARNIRRHLDLPTCVITDVTDMTVTAGNLIRLSQLTCHNRHNNIDIFTITKAPVLAQ
jgi:hypothetical protein